MLGRCVGVDDVVRVISGDPDAPHPTLRLDSVSWWPDGAAQPRLRDITVHASRSRPLVVTGRDGSGRGRMIELVAGVVPASSGGRMHGRIALSPSDGTTLLRPGTTLREWTRHVAWVPARPWAMLTMARSTVIEELCAGIVAGDPSPASRRSRIDDALATFGLERLASRHPGDLSGGETARLALACAWIAAPDLLVWDRVDAGLDAGGMRLLRDALDEAARRRITWVGASDRIDDLIAFDAAADGQAVAESTGDWAAVRLHAGAVEEFGSVRRVLVDGPGAALWWQVRGGRLAAGPTAERVAADDLPEVRDGASSHGPGLRLNRVSVRYRQAARALVDVDLDVSRGEIVALMGANGSGKTSLLRAAAGLVPSKGEVWLCGERATEWSPAARARRLALAFQWPEDQLFATNVVDEVAFGPRNLGWNDVRVDAAVRCALSACGLTERSGAHPLDLRPAQRRRVAIASVLAMGTPVVVLDEPSGGLADDGRAWLASLLRALRASGRAVMVATHDADLVVEAADRVVVLSGGAVLAAGDPRAILTDDALRSRAGLAAPTPYRVARGLGLADDVIDRGSLAHALRRRSRHGGGRDGPTAPGGGAAGTPSGRPLG